MTNLAQLGTINPPGGVPTVGGNPSNFVAGLIRGSISMLLIGGFILSFIWIILAGFRFITSGSDSKSVSSAWAQIYWGLIGMIVVLGAFAIIKLVETFFGVTIVSGGFQLPTR